MFVVEKVEICEWTSVRMVPMWSKSNKEDEILIKPTRKKKIDKEQFFVTLLCNNK